MSGDRTRPPPTAGPPSCNTRTVISDVTTNMKAVDPTGMGSRQRRVDHRGAQCIEQLVAEGADGGPHQPRGLLAVARLERGEQRAVLVARSQAAPAGPGAQRDQPRALAVVEQPRDDERGPAVAPAVATPTWTARLASMNRSTEAGSSRSSAGSERARGGRARRGRSGPPRRPRRVARAAGAGRRSRPRRGSSAGR